MFAGIDTSNYTTSVAVFDGEHIIQKKQLLIVKKGERGLRQSEALFQHTVNLPILINRLKEETGELNLEAIGVSNRPRNAEGSYMPCFLAGKSAAASASSFCSIPLYETSHQVGHILAALYSVGKPELINDRFIAFHVSGGTTEAVLVTPDDNDIIKAEVVSESTDLKAGQAIDRTGVLLGIDFPCGPELEKLSLGSNENFKIKPTMIGMICSLSGIENKVKKMISDNCPPQDVAKFAICSVCESLSSMAQAVTDKYGNMPLVFAGGVSGNKMIAQTLKNRFGAYFAEPQFSSDNAAGIAIYAYLKSVMQ